MAKKRKASIKIKLAAGIAKPSPKILLELLKHNINSQEFFNAFNRKTKDMEHGLNVNVEIQVFTDKSFSFKVKKTTDSSSNAEENIDLNNL